MSVFDDVVNKANKPEENIEDDGDKKNAVFTDYGKAFRAKYGEKPVDHAKEEPPEDGP